MNSFLLFIIVEIETRGLGSIGVFKWRKFGVMADNRILAIKWALEDAFAEGFETRGARIVEGEPTREEMSAVNMERLNGH